ncbi:hypothetical protein GPALN_005015 [Globodera pallida]|nr:hypothetical protein GPALN_005015 [Globodera pallida]
MAPYQRHVVVLRRQISHFVLSLLLLSAATPSSDGLSCYQGLANLSVPLSGSATQCPGMMALSCIKAVDYNSGQVTRSCQATNCTVQTTQSQVTNNQQQQQQQQPQQAISTVAVCVNNTASTFCCCYGDGCNSALSPGAMASLLRYSIPIALLLIVGGILC